MATHVTLVGPGINSTPAGQAFNQALALSRQNLAYFQSLYQILATMDGGHPNLTGTTTANATYTEIEAYLGIQAGQGVIVWTNLAAFMAVLQEGTLQALAAQIG